MMNLGPEFSITGLDDLDGFNDNISTRTKSQNYYYTNNMGMPTGACSPVISIAGAMSPTINPMNMNNMNNISYNIQSQHNHQFSNVTSPLNSTPMLSQNLNGNNGNFNPYILSPNQIMSPVQCMSPTQCMSPPACMSPTQQMSPIPVMQQAQLAAQVLQQHQLAQQLNQQQQHLNQQQQVSQLQQLNCQSPVLGNQMISPPFNHNQMTQASLLQQMSPKHNKHLDYFVRDQIDNKSERLNNKLLKKKRVDSDIIVNSVPTPFGNVPLIDTGGKKLKLPTIIKYSEFLEQVRYLKEQNPDSLKNLEIPEKGNTNNTNLKIKSLKTTEKLDLDKMTKNEKEIRTTMMLRNIPNKYTQAMILKALEEHEFYGKYDFFYLPIDFRNRCNVGYAFINFIIPEEAKRFYKIFNLYKLKAYNSPKVCEVNYARVQGLEANIEVYRNSPVNGIPVKQYRPLIFLNGIEQEFPEPDAPLPPIQLREKGFEELQ